MCSCTHIFVCVYTSTHMCVHVWVCVLMCLYSYVCATGVHTCICICICLCTCACVYAHVHICMHICMYVNIYTYVHVCADMCADVCVCVCVYVYACMCVCVWSLNIRPPCSLGSAALLGSRFWPHQFPCLGGGLRWSGWEGEKFPPPIFVMYSGEQAFCQIGRKCEPIF